MTGGVESVMAAQARMLSGAGHHVVVLAGRGDCTVLPELDSRHPEVESVTRELAAGGDVQPAFDRLRDLISCSLAPHLSGCDLVLVHNALTMPFNVPLAHALLGCGRQLVAWTHDLAWSNPRHAAFQRREGPLGVLAEAQPRTRYVAISRQRRREVSRIFGISPRRVAVVPNAIDEQGFLGISPATLDLARRAGFGSADPLLLAPVRVTRRKRLELALEAAARLLPEEPRLRLVISGPLGPHSADNAAYAGELRRLAARLGLEGTVCFLCDHPLPGGEHPVDDRIMGDLYRLADAVLLTSESEGFGLPLLEAGLLRLPLVCADIPVFRELGRGGVWRFAAGSAEAAATAVSGALATPGVRRRRRIRQVFSWPAVLRQTEAVIGECIGRA